MTTKDETKILFVTASVSMAKELLQAFQKEKTTQTEKAGFKVFPASDPFRMMELLLKYDFDLMIVEEEFINTPLELWVKKVNNAVLTREVPGTPPPIVLSLREEKSPSALRGYLTVGFAELIVRPWDIPVVVQKIDQMLPDKGILAAPELYKMQTSEPVAVAVTQMIEAISEVEVTILSSTKNNAGDVVSLYGMPFSAPGENREVVALCTACIDSFHKTMPYRITYRLQGVTPSLSKNIRQWIKKASLEEASIRIG